MEYIFKLRNMHLSWLLVVLCLAINSGLAIKVVENTQVISVRNGSDRVIMDCRYEMEGNHDEEGLVVKWYYDGKAYPVYQWVVGEKPQAFRSLRNKLDLLYKPSENKFFKSRALYVKNPTVEFSGNYTCTVSNFNDVDKKIETVLIVYTPATYFNITIDSVDSKDPDVEVVVVECTADGLSPQPEMKIVKKVLGSSNSLIKPLEYSAKIEPTHDAESHYIHISQTYQIYQRESVEFTCSLSISSTDYLEERRITHVARENIAATAFMTHISTLTHLGLTMSLALIFV